ncbi:MAG: PCC domain-containing protein [Prochlorococcaceae cyanobacterium]
MRCLALHLDAGADLRLSLQALARPEAADGFVLSVVGNLTQAAFQCPGRPEPTVLAGDLEIITLQGTVAASGVHLHLSFADAACQVWGGHLEPGTLVKSGADLLVGFLDAAGAPSQATPQPPINREPRVAIAVLRGCPFSQRAERLLRTLGIPHRLETVESPEQRQAIAELSGRSSLPQVFIDGQPIGGYAELAEWHGRGALDGLRA